MITGGSWGAPIGQSPGMTHPDEDLLATEGVDEGSAASTVEGSTAEGAGTAEAAPTAEGAGKAEGTGTADPGSRDSPPAVPHAHDDAESRPAPPDEVDTAESRGARAVGGGQQLEAGEG